MPTNRLVAKEQTATYAGVLLDALHEEGGQDAVLEVREQLETVARYVRTSVDLVDALSDASYTTEQRNTLAKNVFTEAGFHPLLIDTLAVMSERGDIGSLSRVKESFGEQLQSKFDITVVDVTTAVSLDDNLRELINKKAAADLGTNIVLREHIDTSILGGIVMSANGKRIDASVLSQLESARNVLKQSTDGGES